MAAFCTLKDAVCMLPFAVGQYSRARWPDAAKYAAILTAE
jgi:hypothetical protein